MRNRGWRPSLAAVAAAATLLTSAAWATASSSARGVVTRRDAQLVVAASGVRVRPILSAGDVVGGDLLGYQMSGVPDGIGAYRSSDTTVEVLVNHQLAGETPRGVGARLSRLTLDNRRRVLAARYLLDGSEGFRRFSSATLETLDGVPWYFTGEASIGAGEPPAGGRGGSSIALDVATGTYHETRHFGLFAHGSVVPVQGLDAAMVVSPEAGPAGRSQLYAYTAGSFAKAIGGQGRLWVWRADGGGDGDPSSDDIAKGETLHGRFVAVRQADNAGAGALEAAAQAKGGFDFVRLGDAAVGGTRSGELWLTDTGAAGGQTERGRLYRLQIDPRNPTAASLTLVLDGDARRRPRQPRRPRRLRAGRGHPGGPRRRQPRPRGRRRPWPGAGLRPPLQTAADGRAGGHRPGGELGVLWSDRRLRPVRRGLVAARRPGPRPNRPAARAGPRAPLERWPGWPAPGRPDRGQHLNRPTPSRRSVGLS